MIVENFESNPEYAFVLAPANILFKINAESLKNLRLAAFEADSTKTMKISRRKY